jgi:acetylornithine aminotransferase
MALGSPLVAGVRGAGLLLGIVLTEPVAAAVVDALRERAVAGGQPGFLANAAQPDVIRLAPPLILTATQAAAFVDALGDELDAVSVGSGVGSGAHSTSGAHSANPRKDEVHAALSA